MAVVTTPQVAVIPTASIFLQSSGVVAVAVAVAVPSPPLNFDLKAAKRKMIGINNPI